MKVNMNSCDALISTCWEDSHFKCISLKAGQIEDAEQDQLQNFMKIMMMKCKVITVYVYMSDICVCVCVLQAICDSECELRSYI